jgi:hypothetical protein
MSIGMVIAAAERGAFGTHETCRLLIARSQ